MINMYGLRVSSCMVPRLIFIRGVVSNVLLAKDMVGVHGRWIRRRYGSQCI